MLASWLLRLVALDSKAAGGYCWLLFVVHKHLFIDWNMSVTQNSFLLCRIAASKITISSQAHECVRWLERERILPTASWPRRPGLCWRITINHWRRIKGGVSGETNMNTHVMFTRINVGTTDRLSNTTLWLLSVSLSHQLSIMLLRSVVFKSYDISVLTVCTFFLIN